MSSLSANRRQALFGGLCLCCLPTLGRSAEGFGLDEVGPGIFIRRGPDAEATADNADAIANIGFIVGEKSVLVTESGGSLTDGQWLRAEIAKRTDKPISHVVLTHVHPDHCFGAAAFSDDKPVFVGHHALRSALDARGEYYRNRLVEILGPDKAGSVVYPTLEVKDGAEIDIGGRTLRFTAHGTAHTNCDLSMRDSGSGILFPADLLFVTRIPSLDGSLIGWLKQTEVLKAMGATKAVPGHGPTLVDFAPAMADLTRYLTTLRDETRKAVAADLPIDKAISSIGRSERDKWVLFDTYNGRNVTQAFKELEWE
ncbi:quinoprotein relay system zinc metallohydrolase 2 [Methylobacterium sp. BTF04]|uniref:quinoprotein relay system zinc metallohydrolase 2 n=1 Tax=Methylobacterium sp. BTF04 TaxID=2708300 RepID=UPI0013D45F0A|nr:quinoprotein relay system zinc metallohydrolase 2 [Methylobacterium sp. BTF04]NEU13204.1 quinoprotein relay system zinc metallohydrolase 2 [Methylobacterium sp. BTF04]